MAAILQLPTACGATPEDWAHFDMVLGLTEDLLPVVSNPKAVISPDSAMKDLGKTPSRYNGNRQVVGFGAWTQHRASAEDISRWSRERDFGICLQTRRVRAIDVDVADQQHADAIAAFIATHAGPLPFRCRGNSAKFLLAFELPGEYTKRKFKSAHGIVEFLATGQQFIAVGTHPSGVRYQWSDDRLPDAFPALDAERFEALWSALVTQFAIEDPGTSSVSVKARKLADVLANDPVAQFLIDTNRVRRSERDGRLHITCPFEAEHTTDSGETATTYFPAHTGGYVNGHFQCLHAHCEHRSDQEFLDAIGFVPAANEFEAIADAPAPEDKPLELAQGEGKQARFAFLQAAAFVQSEEPQEWLIENVLPHAALGVIYGESGSGKTFAALDMLCSLATGSPWRGLEVSRCVVAYVAAEGARGVRKRLRAVSQQRGLDLDALDIHVLADAPNLMEKQDALDLAKAVKAIGGVKVVVVDTFAQTTPGANENSGEDMGRALAHCKGIHRATGALVMLVHHSGKDPTKGARGWSGIKGALDVEFEVSKDGDKRSLFVSKMKDGEDGMEYQFRLHTVVVGLDAKGREESSCVVEHVGDVARRTDRPRPPKGSVERLVLAQLEELSGVTNEPVEHPILKEAVRGQIPHDEASGRDRRGERIERAIESLIGAGRVAVNGNKLRVT